MACHISNAFRPTHQPPPPTPEFFKDKTVPYDIPLSAEQFIATAKKIAFDHRVKHPEPLDKDMSPDKFMFLNGDRTPAGYKVMLRSSILGDKTVYLVAWNGDDCAYTLDVYRKDDHQEFKL